MNANENETKSVLDSAVRALLIIRGYDHPSKITHEDAEIASGSTEFADKLMAHLAESAAKNVTMEIVR